MLQRWSVLGSGSHPTADKLAIDDDARQALLPPRPAGSPGTHPRRDPAGPRRPKTMSGKADVNMRTRYDDIEQNEVLWITPEVCRLPELPDGFALRVDDFLGWDHTDGQQPRRVWVRGPVLLNARDAALQAVTLCVPVDQPRAVLADRTPAAEVPPQPVPVEAPRAVGVASTGGGAHRADERDVIEHAGRVYRRVEFPRR